jgi:acyl-CoA dehydrogenase
VVETDGVNGFWRGSGLDKIGLHASYTSELFFDEVVVPSENLLDPGEGFGFAQLMEQLARERLALAIQAVAATERTVEITVAYTKDRKIGETPIIEFQNIAFKLADGELDQVTASIVKWWTAAKPVETADECLQLHGGYGYMRECEIARRFVDARVQKIYDGSKRS